MRETIDPQAVAGMVREQAAQLGFGLLGVAEARSSDHQRAVRDWLAAGHHGEMHYLAEHVDVRLDPRQLLAGARAVIAVADFYPARTPEQAGPHAAPPAAPHADDAPVGQIARYAWGDDYHKLMKKRLHRLADALRAAWPEAAFKCVVDTAPALEREHALRAGLGWVGKNTMLIHPRLGSWFLLGLIVTTLPITQQETECSGQRSGGRSRETAVRDERAEPADSRSLAQPSLSDQTTALAHLPVTDHCGTCTRCIDACPTRCITSDPAMHSPGGRRIDADRCISYLTIEHRSLIEPSMHEAMGDWIAGCDVCQTVCPFNQRSAVSGQKSEGGAQRSEARMPAATRNPESRTLEATRPIHPRYAPRPLARGIPLLDILNWTADERREAFRGSALKRIKLDMIRRNALIAAGNHLAAGMNKPLRQRIEAIAADADEPALVQQTARQVISRLRKASPRHPPLHAKAGGEF